jgi:hypothetical protein
VDSVLAKKWVAPYMIRLVGECFILRIASL